MATCSMGEDRQTTVGVALANMRDSVVRSDALTKQESDARKSRVKSKQTRETSVPMMKSMALSQRKDGVCN